MNTKDLERYRGVIPALYACYDDEGRVDPGRTARLAEWLVARGVKGLYLCGSSGECIYQSVAERKRAAEAVFGAVGGKTTLIVHVGGVGTPDAMELARHAEGLGADAVASIPPIYFRLPEESIARYWNDISAAAPDTHFIIYNIPQLAGVSLTPALLRTMTQNPRLAGVKNSSMPVQDIETFKRIGGARMVVFNGPDEQYLAGRAMGADGGIGGTYGVMPGLFLAMDRALAAGDLERGRTIQYEVNHIIATLLRCKGNLYAALKGVLRMQGLAVGGVRGPLAPLAADDSPHVEEAHRLIETALARYTP